MPDLSPRQPIVIESPGGERAVPPFPSHILLTHYATVYAIMNAWTPTSTPSMDLFSSQSTSSALMLGWHVVSTLPRRLWDAYLTHLLFYQSNSWVGRLASTFRILAVILVLPVVFLTLLVRPLSLCLLSCLSFRNG